jgi:hypothetical protein
MAIGNFTPDEIRWEHQGLSGIIKPDEVITDKGRGWENHVLNRWGARGLVRLDYGADETKARKASLEQYEKFWEYQISNFNELNAQLKNEGKMYVRPTKQLKEHAERFGIELIGPWTLKRTSDDPNIIPSSKEESNAKVDALEQRVSGIESNLEDIAGMLKSMMGKEEGGKKK